jgi:sigma-B regulation protein RsbU (phosphoserine phosphatase)
VSPIAATGLPVGMFCQETYETVRFNLKKGDRLLLYTDGLSEARDVSNEEYGGRLHGFVSQCNELAASQLVNNLIDDMRQFSKGTSVTDDLTVMAIEMVGH